MSDNNLHDKFFAAVSAGQDSRVRGILADHPEAIGWRYTANGMDQPVTMIAHDVLTLQILLENKADPNASDRIGDTRLIQCGDGAGTASLLLLHGADVDKANNAGLTPLMRAAFNHATNVVKVLIQNGANPELTNKEGKTAEMIAQERSYPDLVEQIHEYAGTWQKKIAVQESEKFHSGLDHKINVTRPLAMKNTGRQESYFQSVGG